MTIDLTHRCNCRCAGCIELRARLCSRNASLHTETVCRLLSEFAAQGGREVLFYGGEPTLHKGFQEAVLLAARLFERVRVVTNGTLLSHPAIARALRDAAGMTDLSVRPSLNSGRAETHEEHFGVKGLFPRVLDGMKAMAANGVPFGVSFLLGEENAVEVAQAYNTAREFGATDFWLRPKTGLHSVGMEPLSDAARTLALQAIRQLNNGAAGDGPAFHSEPWHVSFLEWGTLPDTSKPYPHCYYCGASRIVITPPEPGVVWACTYWRADERFLIADLNEVPFGSAEFERRRVEAIRRICPSRDCAGVICNRNEANKVIWAHLRGAGASQALAS